LRADTEGTQLGANLVKTLKSFSLRAVLSEQALAMQPHRGQCIRVWQITDVRVSLACRHLCALLSGRAARRLTLRNRRERWCADRGCTGSGWMSPRWRSPARSLTATWMGAGPMNGKPPS